MHDNGLTGIADADSLCLGIVDDIDSHLQICTLIHINMAVTGAGLDDRDRTVFHDSADQPCASTWNQHIHILPQPHKACSRLMICHLDQLKSVLSHTNRRERFFQY